MGTIADKYRYTLETKKLIKQALISVGAVITDDMPFRQYVEIIKQLNLGAGAADITQNNIAYYRALDTVNSVQTSTCRISEEDYLIAEAYLQTIYSKIMLLGEE